MISSAVKLAPPPQAMECWGPDNEATAEISFISKFLTVSGANYPSLLQLFLCTVTEITPTVVIYWLVKDDETDRRRRKGEGVGHIPKTVTYCPFQQVTVKYSTCP